MEPKYKSIRTSGKGKLLVALLMATAGSIEQIPLITKVSAKPADWKDLD